MTTMTIENEFGAVTIKVHKDDMNIAEVIDELFIPAMNGLGYSVEYGSITHEGGNSGYQASA